MMGFKRQSPSPLAKLESTGPAFEELLSADDLVRRWTNNHNDNLNVEPGTH